MKVALQSWVSLIAFPYLRDSVLCSTPINAMVISAMLQEDVDGRNNGFCS